MRTNRTFTMIKPNAVENGHIGAIIQQITEGGFKILAMKYTHLSADEARKFYEIHKEKPFFETLVSFMSRSPIVVMVLEKENAVEDFRKFIGATNPEVAEKGTIRQKYGKDVTENAIHGADSNENAEKEASFYFSKREIFG